jgi:hypothetical protein
MSEPGHGEAGTHAVSFMCDDVHATVRELREKGSPSLENPGTTATGSP